jgi:hypothetical protein
MIADVLLRSVSSVLIRGQILLLRSRRCRRFRRFLQPSACVLQPLPPPPHSALLKTNAQVPFDSTVDRTVEAFFLVLSGTNLGSISASNCQLQCPVGRGSQLVKAARRKTGVLDEPAVGLAGWKTAAPQTVIVSERGFDRESNDLSSGEACTSVWLEASS